jgi:hypothetical protein
MHKLFLLILGILWFQMSMAQCCSGGAGSPLAGGTSQGVLPEGQLELNTNLQYIFSDQFYSGSQIDTNKYFEEYRSLYQYFRLAYGLSPKLTISLESGNYFFKEEVGLNFDPERSFRSSGFSDLIIFPRYQLFHRTGEKYSQEATLGLGVKLPIGSYNDSTMRTESFSGEQYYLVNPLAVQATSGAIDLIVYGFYMVKPLQSNTRFFANLIYLHKGWNPRGEKTGEFASLGLFASHTLKERFTLTLQTRAEWMGTTQINETIFMYAYPNYDPEATGYKKIFISPQVGVSFSKITAYLLADLPVIQNLTKTQVGSKIQITGGLSFRI